MALGIRARTAVTFGTGWMNVTDRVTVDGTRAAFRRRKARAVGWCLGLLNQRRDPLALPCHVMRRTDVFQIRIEPELPPPRATSRRTARQRQRLGSRRHHGGTRPRIPGRPRCADETTPRRLETLQARRRLGRRTRRTRCRRARGGPRAEPRSASPTAGAAPGRPRSPRSSPATSSASSSATLAGRRGSRPCSTRSPSPRREHQARPRAPEDPRERTTRNQAATRRLAGGLHPLDPLGGRTT